MNHKYFFAYKQLTIHYSNNFSLRNSLEYEERIILKSDL